MTKVLLDTHTLLWFMKGDMRLSSIVKHLIENEPNRCYVSIVSFWEISIKYSLGKLDLGLPIEEAEKWVSDSGMNTLSLLFSHTLQLSTLPFHHRDPFDRTLIAQALAENMTILTKEELFKNYGVNVFW